VQAFFDDLARDSNVGGDAPAAPSTALMAAGFLSEQRLPEGRQAGKPSRLRRRRRRPRWRWWPCSSPSRPWCRSGIAGTPSCRRRTASRRGVRRGSSSPPRPPSAPRSCRGSTRTSASASATSATRNTGAQVIPDLRTRAVAPPALLMTEQPRLTDARSAPSVVARGGTSRRRRSRRRR